MRAVARGLEQRVSSNMHAAGKHLPPPPPPSPPPPPPRAPIELTRTSTYTFTSNIRQ